MLVSEQAGPRLVSEQVIGLAGGWRNAWMHELRGPHGEWVSGAEKSVVVGDRIAYTDSKGRHRTGKVISRSAPIEGHVYAAQVQFDDGLTPRTQSLETRKLHVQVPHGEEVSPGEGAADALASAGQYEAQAAAARNLADQFSKGPGFERQVAGFRKAAAAFESGDVATAAQALHETAAASRADKKSGMGDYVAKMAEDMIPKVHAETGSPEARAVGKVLQDTGKHVTGYFNKGTVFAWDGKTPSEFKQADNPALLGQMDWRGHMSVSDDTALAFQSAIGNPGEPVHELYVMPVVLHEMIHANVEGGSYIPGTKREADHEAYLDPAMQEIEEGFTQLATAQHAADWFGALGISDRQISGDNPRARQLADINGVPFVPDPSITGSLGDYARKMATPEAIRGGTSWPTYSKQTRDAYDFAATLSQLAINGQEDPEYIQLISDSINSVGASDKLRRMAELTMVAGELDQDKALTSKEREAALAQMQASIRDSWMASDPQETVVKAASAFRATVEQMRVQGVAA